MTSVVKIRTMYYAQWIGPLSSHVKRSIRNALVGVSTGGIVVEHVRGLTQLRADYSSAISGIVYWDGGI